jgi:iron complex outermembrane receptor protein
MSIDDLMKVNVYTASRFEQDVSDAPASVNIITASDIKRYGYRTLADILRSMRGLFVTNDRNYSYLGIRGLPAAGGYNGRFLLLVDGVRINDPVFDSAPIGEDFILDVDLIERVEISRGPGSSLYGANAFFGVINVITRRGRELKGLELSGEVGTLKTYRGRISYGNAFPFGLEAMVSGSYFDSKGNERLYYEEFDDPETNDGFAEDCDRERAHRLFGSLSFGDFTLEGAYYDRKKLIPTAPWEGSVFNDDRSYTVDAQGVLNLKYERSFVNHLDVVARINYGYYGYHGDYVTDYAEEGEKSDLVVNKDYARGEWFGAEAQFSKILFEKHRLILGGEYRNNFRQDQGNRDLEIYLDSQEDSEFCGLYLQDEFHLLSHLILNAGVRYDYYSTFGGTTNPRMALIWSPWEKTVCKALYGRAFRPPNAYEFYYHDGYYTTKDNPHLKPETVQTFDLILEQGFGDHLRATINGYYYGIEDFIVQRSDPDDGLLVYRNAEDLRGRGIELELEAKWNSGLTGRASYAYQESEYKKTGADLVNSPRHLAKLNVVLPLLKDKISLGLEEQYTSRRKTIYDKPVDGFFVTNLTLFSHDLLKGLEVSFSVYNLFNNNYGDPGGEEHLQNRIKQDGRNFRLKLTYAF